jgi:hypothetical protein
METATIDKQELIDVICEMKRDDVIELITGDYITKTKSDLYKLNSDDKKFSLIEITDLLIANYGL